MSQYINYDDVVAQIEGYGLVLDKPLTFDARIQRWKTGDSKGGEKPGWSRLKEWQSKAGHLYVVGCFGIWQGNDDGYTRVELPKRDDPQRPALTDEDIAAARAAQKAAQQAVAEQRKAEAKQAAAWSAQVWAHCKPADEHDYLKAKGIAANGTRVFESMEGLRLPGIDGGDKESTNLWRLENSVGALVVPMHDVNGNVVGIQFIYPKGHKFEGKQFWPTGMAMGGSFGLIGPLRRTGVLLEAEGFATAATLHQATGQSVAYAFSANNLGKAAKQIRAKYKQLRILLCADDDFLTEQKTGTNPGVSAAQLAASEIEFAAWTKPDFLEDGADIRNGKKLTDYNDLMALRGHALVAAQINAKLDALGWRDAAPVRGAVIAEGGGEGGSRRAAVSVMSVDELVERFIFIDHDGGDAIFDTWTREVCKDKKLTRMLPPGVRIDEVKRHPLWLGRAVYIDQIGFDPGGTDQNIICNRWAGWPTTPKAGKCDILLDMLRYLCSGEENHAELYQWVLRWLAYPIQYPGAKMHSAIVVHGPQGTGKSRFFEAYAKIFGEYSIILNQGAIEDKFNADWSERKLFVLADEVVANTEKYHLKNQLKNFITSDWVRINPKNVAAHRERNHMNMVFLSNEIQPVVLENDDRRHCVIYTPPKLGDDFYAEVTAEIAAGGIEAMHHFLLHLDLGDFTPWSRPPMTEAKRRLIAVNSGSEERFIAEWIDGHLDIPFCPIGHTQLYAEYTAFCRRENEPFPRKAPFFWGYIHQLGWWDGVTRRLENLNATRSVSWRCCIPSAEAMAKALRKRGSNVIPEPPDGDRAAWLAECYFAVENALQAREGGVRRVA